MKLVIAEKPMLARAISDAIPGKAVQRDGAVTKGDYTIISAFGHLLTLKEPEDYDPALKNWSLETLPIYYEDWGKKPGPGKEERLARIGELLKTADEVIHAGDPDDEGQYLIDEILDWFGYKGPVYRLSTGDTTEAALRKALASMKDNRSFVNAGRSAHARSVADIMVGYNFSRYFTLKNPQVKLLTVGRVQTPTLGLVVTRDALIENHEKQGYFTIFADLLLGEDAPASGNARLTESGSGVSGGSIPSAGVPSSGKSVQPGDSSSVSSSPEVSLPAPSSSSPDIESGNTVSPLLAPVRAKFEPFKDDPKLEDGRITDKDYAEELAGSLTGRTFGNVQVTRKELTEQPPLPFNLVKLQTYCSNKFGYDPSKTLAITQSLRDNHNAITYNRSDCQYLSEEQYKEAPATIRRVFANLAEDSAGKIFGRLPLDTGLHSPAFNDKNITAHTAIIPQNRALDLTKLSEEERNVYLAVVKYFAAQFLPPAKKERTILEAKTEYGTLRAASTKVLAPGYLQLIKPEKKTAGKDPSESGEEGAEEEQETGLSKVEPGTYTAFCENAPIEAKETKAPPRYTKASLNEDMTRIAKYVTDPKAKALLLRKDKEKKGENGSIGTSATRSFIIDQLEARGFIETRGKQIRSTVLGRELYRILPEELKKPDMTGYWWAVQEEIRDGEAPWTALTDSVLEMIRKVLRTEYPWVDAYHVPESMRKGKIFLGSCPRCGKPVIEGTRGFGCSGFRDGCKFVIWKTAKSGMMSKTEITADMVHELLQSKWVDEMKPAGFGPRSSDEMEKPAELKPTGRKRTETELHMKRLYSEAKGKTYAGDVYLTDEGPSSPYGASFGLARITSEGPEILGTCPRCGKPVTEGRLGYGCSGFRDGCKFSIWKNSKQKLLADVTFTKTDAKKFLAGKTVHKSKLTDKKGQHFAADLVMVEEADNPYGPVFRVVSGTISVKEGDPASIRIETVPGAGTLASESEKAPLQKDTNPAD